MKGKGRTVMCPFLVAVSRPKRNQSKGMTRLAHRLIRCGFRVQSLRVPEEKISLDSDIVLVPFQINKVHQLADTITQRWTEQWLAWYTRIGWK